MRIFRRRERIDPERVTLALEEISLRLLSINHHLSRLASRRDEESIERKPAPLPQPIIDAAELLARKLWLELPDEAKEDLSS